jgi:multiple sugar transport system substrate-binding protein
MPFIGGSYSIMLDGEWRVEHLRKYAPNLDYRTVFLPPPQGGRPRASYSVTNFITIPQGAREVEGAWEFIRYWTGLDDIEASADRYPPLGWMPCGPRATQTPAYQKFLREAPQYKTFLELAKSDAIEITPPVTYQLFLMDRIQRYDDMATRGSMTAEAAIRQLEADVMQERARRKELGYAE